jgi:hypothetical protein
MVEGEFLSAQYSRANVVARVARQPWMSLATLAECHRRTNVSGQAEGTQDAERPDLRCLRRFPTQLYRHKEAFGILQRMLRQANIHPTGGAHPCLARILPHMLPRKVANEKGVHYAVAPCGYRSDRYIGCHAQLDARSLADAIDQLD